MGDATNPQLRPPNNRVAAHRTALAHLAGLVAVLPVVALAELARADQPSQLVDEQWFLVCANDQPIGRSHATQWRLHRQGEDLLEFRLEETLTLRRGDQTVETAFHTTSRERADGSVVEIRYELPIGAQPLRGVARVKGRHLEIRSLDTPGQVRQLEWPSHAQGPFADMRSLREDPLQPGDRRRLTMFAPPFEEMVELKLFAKDWENVSLLAGEFSLLRVEATTKLSGGPSLRATYWVDSAGQVLKQHQQVGVSITIYLVTQEVAESEIRPADLDLFSATLIRLENSLDRPHDAARLVYEIKSPSTDPAELFVADERQSIESLGARRVRLTVRSSRARSGSAALVLGGKRPTRADRDPSPLVESADPAIRRFARRAAPTEEDPIRVATALEKLVHESITVKSYSKVFATAREVLQSREGDCTEHTTLLVALCRARGVPARGAMGLVYSAPHDAMAYHMWTEAWTGKGWLSLDATLSQAGVGPTHLKVADTSLDGPASLVGILSFLQSAEGLTIRVVGR